MKALAEYEMTPEQWQIMATLWGGKVLSQADIVTLTLKDKHNVSRIIQRLVDKGWVDKGPDPDDARATLIKPTKSAWQLRDKIPRKLLRHFDPIYGALSDREYQQTMKALKKLRNTLGDEC